MTSPIDNQYGNNYGNYQVPTDYKSEAPQSAGGVDTKDTVPPPGNGNTSGANDVPDLPTSTTQTIDWTSLVGITAPSFGANVLALVQETMNEQRQDTQQARYDEHMAVSAKMVDQAEEMREKATQALALGLTAAVVSFAASAFTTIASASALKSNMAYEKAYGAEYLKSGDANLANLKGLEKGMSTPQANIYGQKMQGISGMISTLGKLFETGEQYNSAMHDANIKEMDAQIEKIRANIEVCTSLIDSLKEVLKSARENQNAIQSDVNQTKRRILTA